MSSQREQKLVDISFECVFEAAMNDWFRGKTREEIAEWFAKTLADGGFPTKPMGSSWGVLTRESPR